MNNSAVQARKAILSVGVVATFLAYSFALRHQSSGPVIAPPSLKNNSSSTPTRGSSNGSANNTNAAASHYKDGTYTGSVADAFYGNVQVQVTVKSGRLADVTFLQYPNDSPNSQNISQQAVPFLQQEAIRAQSAKVDIVTGATQTSQAFIQSLSSALTRAQAD